VRVGALGAFAFDHGAGGDGDGLAGDDPPSISSNGISTGAGTSQSTSSMKSKRSQFGIPNNLILGMPARSRATWRLVLSTHHGHVV
jgi:hypothetical protein